MVMLFNYYGYRLVFSYMQSSSDANLEKQVDKDRYDRASLITIKTKLDLPYYTSSTQYERAYGSVTIKGVNYQYVKRRVHNDTLELLCLPNEARTRIQAVSNDLTKTLADGQASNTKKNTTVKITLPDFFQPFRSFSAWCFKETRQSHSAYTSSLSEGHYLKHKQPPRTELRFSC